MVSARNRIGGNEIREKDRAIEDAVFGLPEYLAGRD
jgi:hypothetical protein